MPQDSATPASTIALAPTLDLNAAGPLHQQLLAMRGQSIAVDASKVERLGAQCLQVLLSARQTWSADGAPFAVIAASPAFDEAVASFGAPPFAATPTLGEP